jgi:hypothetical protein
VSISGKLVVFRATLITRRAARSRARRSTCEQRFDNRRVMDDQTVQMLRMAIYGYAVRGGG